MNTDQAKGFTLLELLIAVALLGVLLGLAAPAFSELIQRNRSEALQNQLMSTLHMARAHAVENRHEVEVCGSSDGTACDNAWSKGWLIHYPESGSTPLFFTPMSNGVQLKWAGLSQKIRFESGGLAVTSNGTFSSCSMHQEIEWQIKLNRQGRARTLTAEAVASAGGYRCK
ncbi:GspH/FimT family pseudopilin [Pseudomonas sp. UBA6310]|uniref:GspH/FimT family pseudopilin n=1 Tax=Pseudomonas sp. UBA6310 TaxID=1947327 RepID=UPI00257BE664|nr:GspH/FimT family pseudopilin [Pseudomonas sp. UBA6310]